MNDGKCEIDLLTVVRKLVGPVRPVGETREDEARFANLKQLTQLVDGLVYALDAVAKNIDRPEASVKRAGKHAYDFLNQLRAELRR